MSFKHVLLQNLEKTGDIFFSNTSFEYLFQSAEFLISNPFLIIKF